MSQLEINGHPHSDPLSGSGQDLAAPGGNPGDPQQIAFSRRNLLKILVAGGSATAIHLALPGEWVRPIVEIGVLPVHAAISESPAVGSGPTGVVVIGDKAYVTNQTANTMSIVTLNITKADSTVVAFVPYPTSTVTASMGGKRYIAEAPGGRGQLSVFSEVHGGWVGSIPLSHPATAIAAAQGRVYAAGGDSLWVIDAAADIVLTTLGGFTAPSAMTLEQNRLYVTDSGKRFEIDLTTDQFIGSAPVALSQEQAAQPLADNQLAPLTTPFNGPGDMVYANGQLFIVNETGNFLSILSLDEGKVRNVPVGKTPKAVAVADGVAYVTNFGDNTLSVVTLAGLVPQVVTVPNVGEGPWGIDLFDQDIYVGSHNDDKLLRLRKIGGGFQITDLGLANISKPRQLKVVHSEGHWTRVCVACSGNATVQIVDVAVSAPTIFIGAPVGDGPWGLSPITPGSIWVTCTDANRLYNMDLFGKNIDWQVTGAAPRGVAVSHLHNQTRIIVAAFSDNKIKLHTGA